MYIANSFKRLILRQVLRNINATIISSARDISPSPGIDIIYTKKS
jgi:hypothetical protein